MTTADDTHTDEPADTTPDPITIDGADEIEASVDDSEPVATSSRRGLIKLAAGAAAAGGAIAVATAGTAAAADGDSVNAGERVTQGNSGSTTTIIDYERASGPIVDTALGSQPGNIFLARDREPSPFVVAGSRNASAYPAAVAGYAFRAVNTGVYGVCRRADGYGVVGSANNGSTGILAIGERANLMLHNDGAAPPQRSDTHSRGEIVADSEGRLWYCTADGSPGTWQLLASSSVVSAFNPLAPSRVFDSRFTTNFTSGSNRTVSVKDRIDVTTGAVSSADLIPVGVTAITANVTVTRTSSAGFITINPGGDTTANASTVNWSSANQNLANAGNVLLNASRQVEVICGGVDGATDVIIDVTGYYA